jgi:hypothetical protein
MGEFPDLGDVDDLGHGLLGDQNEPDVAPIAPGALELDTPGGPRLLDAPTVDTDGNGVADTAVTPGGVDGTGDGLLGLATDLDGDAHVDVLTTIDATGAARTVAFPAPGPWDEGVPPPPPIIDPATGRWTRVAP